MFRSIPFTLVISVTMAAGPTAAGPSSLVPPRPTVLRGVAEPPSVPPSPSESGLAPIDAPAPPDSQELLERARSRQRRFERLRRNRLPRVWPPDVDRCDEFLGRYCLWHDDEDEPEIPPEPEEVARARSELLRALEAVADSIPGDGWVAGQRVRYLVEAGRPHDALTVARACRTRRPGWWCTALTGYALHHIGAFPAADSAFRAALHQMPEEQRCEWQDISLFLDGAPEDRYERAPCGSPERSAMQERFWWLADPLYLYPGNDRRTEHLARRALDRLQEDAASPFGTPWGSDLRKILMRYGWPAGWERVRRNAASLTSLPSIIAYHHPQGRQFLPPGTALEEPGAVRMTDWPLDPVRPRTSYAPRYARPIELLEHQLARFRRQDSTLLVAAFDLQEAVGWSDHPVEAALFAAPDAATEPVLVQTRPIVPRDVITARVPPDPTLLSLEVLSRSGNRAARARYGLNAGLGPRIVLTVSDLLLLASRPPTDPDTPEAPTRSATLADVLPRVQGSLDIEAGGSLGLYWEVYGLGLEPVELTVALRLLTRERSWLHKVAESIGLADEERPTVLRWREHVPRGARIWARTLDVQVPDLPDGSYRLELWIETFGREPVRAARQVVVRAE